MGGWRDGSDLLEKARVCIFARLYVGLSPSLQGEGLPKVGETLGKGPENQLEALARRLEEKYGVRKPREIHTRLCDKIGLKFVRMRVLAFMT